MKKDDLNVGEIAAKTAEHLRNPKEAPEPNIKEIAASTAAST